MFKKIILIFLFSPLFLQGQNSSIGRKTSFGLFVSPELNGMFPDPRIQHSSKARFSFTAGINLNHNITKKVSIISGLGFGIRRYDDIEDGLHFPSDLDPIRGFISTSKIVTNFSYLQTNIPILIKVDVLPRKWFICSGLETSYFFKNDSKSTIHYGDGQKEKLSILNNPAMINFAYVVSSGYIRDVSEKYSVMIQPMAKFYFKDYIIENSVLFSFGIKVSCNFINPRK